MRPVRDVSELENARVVQSGLPGFVTLRRDGIAPEPIGTIVLMAFRLTEYHPDCDGSLMGTFEHIDKNGQASGWEPHSIGLYPDSDLVVTLEEFQEMFTQG